MVLPNSCGFCDRFSRPAKPWVWKKLQRITKLEILLPNSFWSIIALHQEYLRQTCRCKTYRIHVKPKWSPVLVSVLEKVCRLAIGSAQFCQHAATALSIKNGFWLCPHDQLIMSTCNVSKKYQTIEDHHRPPRQEDRAHTSSLKDCPSTYMYQFWANKQKNPK